MVTQISEELVWNQIVARAWGDHDFMSRLMSDSRTVLREYDLEVPTNQAIEVIVGKEVKIDDTQEIRRFVLPPVPSQNLTEEDLDGNPAVAWYCYSSCYGCGRCGYCGCRCYCY